MYADLIMNKIKVKPALLKNIPQWNLLEKIGNSWTSRIVWAYVIFYLIYSPSWWFFFLLPVHFLMGPIHGAIVNWCGHKYGYRNFKEIKDRSTNALPFDFLTLGELFQNNHHKFPNRPNFGFRKFEFDPVYPVIRLLDKLSIIKLKKK